MSWPTMTDYQEAIQHPDYCFNDPELRRGVAEAGSWGLPKAICGGFATVFQMNCGWQQYAVRCFVHYYPDQEQRYAAIGHYLQQVRLPYTVKFDLLQQGIRVRGQWYPVLKMEWVHGQTLSTYIEANLNNPAYLRDLPDRFTRMVADLQHVSIAHGDLQHGNILVVDGELKLIDYDGMYVPALGGWTSHELGHRNYQHPRRRETDFGPHIDNFSAWVIYLSLLAVSIQPGLWRRLSAGDESLLLRQADFHNAHTSEALEVLSLLRDHTLQPLIRQFRSFLNGGLASIPSLDGHFLPDSAFAPARASSWLEDYVHFDESGQQETDPGSPQVLGSAWLQDYVTPSPTPQVGLNTPGVIEWYATRGYAIVGTTALLAMLLGIIVPGVAAFVIGSGLVLVLAFLGVRYALFPEVIDKCRLIIEAWAMRWQMRIVELQIRNFAAQKRQLVRDKQREISSLKFDVNRYVQQQLAFYPLDRSEIKGVGYYLEQRLKASGITTAADVTYWRITQVEGIGRDRAHNLLSWRRSVEAHIKADALRSLPQLQAAQIADIQQRYTRIHQALIAEEDAARQDFSQKQADHQALLGQLDGYGDVTFVQYLKMIL